MSTLAEFLLARIAEDEAQIRLVGDAMDECQECALAQQPGSPYSLARLLAECQAKRRAVGVACDLAGGWLGRAEAVTPGWDILGLLALPYADHSDYRPEWRA